MPAPAPSASPVQTIRTWQDAPQTPGDWSYRAGPEGTAAHFGSPHSGAQFSMRCRPADRTIELVRAGVLAGPTALVVRTTNGDRSLTAQPRSDGTPSAVASVAASDPLLDAMAFSRGRFAVEIAGLETLYLPAWPEVIRVIEDCR